MPWSPGPLVPWSPTRTLPRSRLRRSRPVDDILSGKVVGEEQPGFGGAPNLVAKSETGAMQIQYMDWQVK